MVKIIQFFNVFYIQIQQYYQHFVDYLFTESDARALGLFRILFGFCMFLDVFQERGLEDADIRFGDPNHCFFPLFSAVKPVSVQSACVIYSVMWIGSLGILFGFKFRHSCFLYLVPYIYFHLLDKSRWNNHSYLFALIVILLSGTNATTYASLDNYFAFNTKKKMSQEKENGRKCPSWNYFILKFQFTLLYVLAAIKKMDTDWFSGYSMRNISKHKMLSPISDIMGQEILDYYLIHLGGFFFDFSAGFLLNFQKTKKLGFVLSFMFHGLNSQLFDIGMFPYVCMASLILFTTSGDFHFSLFLGKVQEQKLKTRKSYDVVNNLKSQKKRTKTQDPRPKICSQQQLCSEQLTNSTIINDKKRPWITFLLLCYMAFQITLPFTHSITKGYNNWTNGLYGYSWDMMVYSWDTLHTKITVKDYITGDERYLDPDVWTTNDRWSSHADMAKQYGDCIARNLAYYNITTIEIYFDIWKSLNGRFQQRIFDPRVDILKAPWSPWEDVPWILPLLQEFSHWRREVFHLISKEVKDWTKSSNVIFVADYPGLALENYLPPQLSNVSIILMKGEIIIDQPGAENVTIKNMEVKEFNLSIMGVNKVPIETGVFHKIHTISLIPSCYMYTYTNKTEDSATTNAVNEEINTAFPICLQIINGIQSFLQEKASAFTRSFFLIVISYLNIFFDVPMVIRKNID